MRVSPVLVVRHEELNPVCLFFQCMKQNLEKYCVQNGIFGDITFELDDGHMKAHRAMLVARCDVMKAMLNGDFREAHANLVRRQLHTFRRTFY